MLIFKLSISHREQQSDSLIFSRQSERNLSMHNTITFEIYCEINCIQIHPNSYNFLYLDSQASSILEKSWNSEVIVKRKSHGKAIDENDIIK